MFFCSCLFFSSSSSRFFGNILFQLFCIDSFSLHVRYSLSIFCSLFSWYSHAYAHSGVPGITGLLVSSL